MSPNQPPSPPASTPPPRGSPDDDPARLQRMLRAAPKSGEIVDRRRGSPADDDELDEGPSRDDIERFNGVTRNCPSCRKDVFDDAAVCYHCGHAFEAAPAGTPRWAIVVVALILASFLLLAVRGVI